MRKGVNLVLLPLWDGEGAPRSSRLEPNDPFATLTHNFAYAKLPLILALFGEGEVGAKDNGGKGKKKSTAIAVLWRIILNNAPAAFHMLFDVQ